MKKIGNFLIHKSKNGIQLFSCLKDHYTTLEKPEIIKLQEFLDSNKIPILVMADQDNRLYYYDEVTKKSSWIISDDIFSKFLNSHN